MKSAFNGTTIAIFIKRMVTMQKWYIMFLMIFFINAMLTLDCHAFRCGNEIVGRGDSTSVVLMKCGPPSDKEQVKVDTQGKFEGQYFAGSLEGSYRGETKLVEIWYYNCGNNDFIYALTFKGKIMVKDDSIAHGSGKSDCTGRK